MRIKLYAGIMKDGDWFNYAEVGAVKGGSLALLDGSDKTGAGRLLNLLKTSVFKLYTEEGKEWILSDNDYLSIKIQDTWKLSREIIKSIGGKETLIFPEFFYCSTCSMPGSENYTEVNEDWDQLVEEGFLDEFYLESGEDDTYWVELPLGIEVQATKGTEGGTYNRVQRRLLNLGDILKLQKNTWADKSEANTIFATWDASIVDIEGMPSRDFNKYVKRRIGDSFLKRYLVYQEDQEAFENADFDHSVGMEAEGRSVSCTTCQSEIGGYLDWTNFFQSLLSKKSSQRKTGTLRE